MYITINGHTNQIYKDELREVFKNWVRCLQSLLAHFEHTMIMNALLISCHTIPVTRNIVLFLVPTMIPSCWRQIARVG